MKGGGIASSHAAQAQAFACAVVTKEVEAIAHRPGVNDRTDKVDL